MKNNSGLNRVGGESGGNPKKDLSFTGLSQAGSIERSETMVMNVSPLYAGRTASSPACLVCLVGPEEMVGRYWTIAEKKK